MICATHRRKIKADREREVCMQPGCAWPVLFARHCVGCFSSGLKKWSSDVTPLENPFIRGGTWLGLGPVTFF